MEVVSPGVNGQTPAASPTTTINPNLLVEYLVELLKITLGASSKDLEGEGSLLSASKRHDTVQRCARFASETQVALYVQKDIVGTEENNGTQGSYGKPGRGVLAARS